VAVKIAVLGDPCCCQDFICGRTTIWNTIWGNEKIYL